METEKLHNSFLPVFDDDCSFEAEEGDGFFIESSEDHDVSIGSHSEVLQGSISMVNNEAGDRQALLDSVAPDATRQDTRDMPAKPILKASVTECIPIKTEKKAWKTLPVPNIEEIKMRRAASLCSFQDFTDDEETNTTMKRTDSKVGFKDITFRDYDNTIGDNPAVSHGAPITLDWGYEEQKPVDLDSYEANRGHRRKLRQMFMTYHRRKNILVHKCGFSEEEVVNAKRDVKKTRNQREFTKYMARSIIPFGKMEEIGESLNRKARRVFKQKKCALDADQPRRVVSMPSLPTVRLG